MSEDKKSGLSFGFTKKKEQNKVVKSALQEAVKNETEEPEYVLSVNEKGIQR